MRLDLRAVAPWLVLCLPACATVVRGPSVDFNVVTDPPGAIVTTDLERPETARKNRHERDLVARGILRQPRLVEPEYYGCAPTPCGFEVVRRSRFMVHVEREGYHDASVSVTNGLGRGDAGGSAAGAAATATGAYVVTYNAVNLAGTVFFASALPTGAVAASTAASVATGVGAAAIGVDLLTGAMLNLQPNPLVLVLVPEDQPQPAAGDTVIDTEDDLKRVLGDREPAPEPDAEGGNSE